MAISDAHPHALSSGDRPCRSEALGIPGTSDLGISPRGAKSSELSFDPNRPGCGFWVQDGQSLVSQETVYLRADIRDGLVY